MSPLTVEIGDVGARLSQLTVGMCFASSPTTYERGGVIRIPPHAPRMKGSACATYDRKIQVALPTGPTHCGRTEGLPARALIGSLSLTTRARSA